METCKSRIVLKMNLYFVNMLQQNFGLRLVGIVKAS